MEESDEEMKKAIKMFEDFYGKEYNEICNVPFRNPNQLVYLGRAVEIIYESDKSNGGGDGLPCLYKHKFHKDDILCTDQGGKQLYILGTKLTVEDRGIVN